MDASIVIPEVPWHLVVNGRRAFSGTFTPGDAQEMAVGRLLAEGFVRRTEHLLAVNSRTEDSGVVRIDATVDASLEARARAELDHRGENGCGLLHFVSCEPDALHRERTAELPSARDFADILRTLFAACDARFPRGGVHAAALWDGGTLRFQAEDVGRHNTIDRVLGAAFLAGEDAAGLGVVLSARISGQMAMAAARAGVAWVASRSMPTSLAARIAECAGLPLLARAARGAKRLGGGAR